MAISGVLHPGHVTICVREMEPAVKHYTKVLGLVETVQLRPGLSLRSQEKS